MRTDGFAYRWRRFLIVLFHWEYWPFSVVYLPVYFYWLYLSLKARSFFFFSTSNPGIENGGFVMESKHKIYELIPTGYCPITVFVPKGAGRDYLQEILVRYRLQFPLVAKPDIGEKGSGVKKLYSFDELLSYREESPVQFIIQPWIPYPREVGIFYCRYPDQEKGRLTGIVRKEFLSLTGDGNQSMEQLILKNDRAFLQLPVLQKESPDILQRVLAPGEEFILVPYGNHSRGALFVDESHLIDEELSLVIDRICREVPGFYYGRLDIRFKTWEALKQGKDFSIIELNGAGSEPTHIYDPRHTLFFAWKEIMRHLRILYRISNLNRRKLNLTYMSFREGLQLLRAKKNYDRLVKFNE